MTVCPPQSHQRQAGLRGREPGEDYEPSPAKNTPLLPEKKGTGAERAVGWAGGIRPRLGALRPKPRAFMLVCPPQSDQRQAGLRGREPGAGRRLRTFSRQKYSPLTRKEGDRCGASGGVGRRDPSSTRRTPSRTAGLYDGLSPTKPPTTGGTQGAGAGSRAKTTNLRPPKILPSYQKRRGPVRSERWGGQAGSVLDSAHSVPNRGPLCRSVPHKATNDRRDSGGGSREPRGGRRLRPFTLQKDSPPPRKEG